MKRPSQKRSQDPIQDATDEEKDKVRHEAHAMAAEIASELADEMGDIGVELAVKALPAVPTVREVRNLLTAAKVEPRDYLIVRLPYYTGIRVGELCKLCFADMFDDGTILIRQGKGGFDRYVCVDAKSMALVRKWQGTRGSKERIIDLHERQVHRIVRGYGMETGLVQKYEAMLRSFSPHSLRHGFATHRYNAGMDLAILQKLLGHRYLTTTMIYVQTSMRQASKQYRKTDPLGKE